MCDNIRFVVFSHTDSRCNVFCMYLLASHVYTCPELTSLIRLQHLRKDKQEEADASWRLNGGNSSGLDNFP